MSKPYHRPAYNGKESQALFSRSINRLMSAFSLHRRADIEAQRSVDAESSTVVPQQPDCKGSLGSQEIDGAESPVFGADCPEGSHLMVVDPRTEQVLAGPFDEVQAAIKRGREISPRAVFEVRVCSTHAR